MSHDSDYIAIGAHSDNGNSSYSGAAFIFDNSGTQLHKLVASDGSTNDKFGWSIAIDSGIVAVGSPWEDESIQDSGAVYLFDANTGLQLQKIKSLTPAPVDRFGKAVSINANFLAVSARGIDENGFNNGVVYIVDVTTGSQLHTLVCPDSVRDDNFGVSLAMNSGLLAIGASAHDPTNGFLPNAGAVYIFDPKTAEYLWKIIPADTDAFQHFGHSVAVENNVVVIGAYGDKIAGTESGSVYVFDLIKKSQSSKLIPSDPLIRSQFGYSVSIHNGIVAVGAPRDKSNGNYAGSVYAFNTLPILCTPDLNEDGDLNFLDVSAYLAAFSSQDPIADFEPDGNFNFLDVSAFLAAFAAGCP